MHIIRQYVVKPICREEHGRIATTYHSIVTGTWRFVFTSTANQAPDHSSVSPTTVQGSTFLSQWDTTSVALHIAAYAGAKLTGFIGEPSSPPMMCVFEGAKKHSVPFTSTALRCTLFLTA